MDTNPDRAQIKEFHPAVVHFRRRLAQLTNSFEYRRAGSSGKLRKVTPLTVQKSLRSISPDVAPSQTQMYRYYSGEAIPDIAVVYELAELFEVSPQSFLPESTERSNRQPGSTTKSAKNASDER